MRLILFLSLAVSIASAQYTDRNALDPKVTEYYEPKPPKITPPTSVAAPVFHILWKSCGKPLPG